MSKPKDGVVAAAKPAAVKKNLDALCAAEERANAAAQIGSQMERVAAFNALQELSAELKSRKAKADKAAAAESAA